MAPEMFLYEPGSRVYGPPLDIWALGVSLYVLFFGMLPWEKRCGVPESFEEYKTPWHGDGDSKTKPPGVKALEIELLSPDIPKRLLNILRPMLQVNEEERKTVGDLLLLPEFKGRSFRIGQVRHQGLSTDGTVGNLGISMSNRDEQLQQVVTRRISLCLQVLEFLQSLLLPLRP